MIKAEVFLKDAKIEKSSDLIKTPVISVILPTYCRGDNGLLKRAINSVLNQTFKEIELIIVDDGSVDSTREVVKKYLEKDNRIIYIRNDINSGVPALRENQGIEVSRGRYIAYQFDDDYWYKDALENLYNTIKEVKENCLVYGKCKWTIIEGKKELIFGHAFNYNELLRKNVIANNSVLHSRDLPYKFGGYDCHLAIRRLCDWDLWLRWAKEVPFIHVDKIVSGVESFKVNSLGKTCFLDPEFFRSIQNFNRNNKLLINNFSNYLLDDLDFIEDSSLKERIFKVHILRWYSYKKDILINKQLCTELNFKKNI